eukprot:CAMPEP_0174729914 /NCGR_PEP_ID=MMETSP1094-20130205/54575_1 /TAXON_ID=156173 /ORGANISM="Chrysochromulina brevifilum, Strain UTEX LB 985" /LENGTH=67 /DNA_ID=CAMNT_0015932091 /DNA_START=550 /DNA_END=750 /DNA_ORIENTATION=-
MEVAVGEARTRTRESWSPTELLAWGAMKSSKAVLEELQEVHLKQWPGDPGATEDVTWRVAAWYSEWW